MMLGWVATIFLHLTDSIAALITVSMPGRQWFCDNWQTLLVVTVRMEDGKFFDQFCWLIDTDQGDKLIIRRTTAPTCARGKRWLSANSEELFAFCIQPRAYFSFQASVFVLREKVEPCVVSQCTPKCVPALAVFPRLDCG